MLDSWRTVRPSKWIIKMDHQNGLSNRFLGWAGPTLFFSRVGACPPCPPHAGAPALVLLDLSDATVDHSVMLQVLQNSFCVRDGALDWFGSYLCDEPRLNQVMEPTPRIWRSSSNKTSWATTCMPIAHSTINEISSVDIQGSKIAPKPSRPDTTQNGFN